jgi:AAA15 family ATPase/GTPase
MEKLEIKNFLTLREVSIDIKRFTILIGPQANGKSIIAKLHYFFRNLLFRQFIQSIEVFASKADFERHCRQSFEEIFPSYAWQDRAFEIHYKTGDIDIAIVKPSSSKGSTNLKFLFSDNLLELYRNAKRYYKKQLEQYEEKSSESFGDAMIDTMVDCIYESSLGDRFQPSVFVPASRSFFANLQKNVFSFLASNITIDPLIKSFGSVYQSSKIFRPRLSVRDRELFPTLDRLRKDIRQEVEKILVGAYVYEDEQDWIVFDKRKVNLANASSGQQEVLPMLLVLVNWVETRRPTVRPTTFFIEEPEAHLFPLSQRTLIGIFSRIHSLFPCSFVLTTHSPYILTAVNNLILAANILKKRDGVGDQVQKIIGADSPIDFNNVSAYTIEDGLCNTILEKRNRLIGSSVIDGVSDEFDNIFDKLLELYPA